MRIDSKKKLAGLLIPVFALRHENDFGVGDTKSMRDAIDFCSDNKIGVLQILPINETGGDNSPYNAISSVALDPIYVELAPQAVPGLSNEIIANLAHPELLKALRQGAVDYLQVKSLKVKILRAAFDSFEQSDLVTGSVRANELAEFEKDNARWIEPYSLFRTIMAIITMMLDGLFGKSIFKLSMLLKRSWHPMKLRTRSHAQESFGRSCSGLPMANGVP